MIKAGTCFDVGKAIDQTLVKAQVEGGFVQGLSSTMFEEIRLRNGVMTNPSFVDYRIATAADTNFKLDATYAEVPQDDGRWERAVLASIRWFQPSLLSAMHHLRRYRSPPGRTSILRGKIYLAMLDAGIVK